MWHNWLVCRYVKSITFKYVKSKYVSTVVAEMTVIWAIRASYVTEKTERLKLENHARRSNLRFYGLYED